MFARVVISTLLIVAGISSPWLVKDWLDSRSHENGADGISRKLSEFSDRIRGGADESDGLAMTRVDEDRVAETSESLEPYPLATKAKKMLQGWLPSSLGVQSMPSHPFEGASSSPESESKARQIIEATRGTLEGELRRLGLEAGNPIFVRLFKEENELELWMKSPEKPEFTLFKIYRIQRWSGTKGPKLREGDGQSPEGFYFVSPARLRSETRHHLGIDLGFPNEYDSEKGRTGSEIMIHAGASSAGSYVLTPSDMNELYTLAALAFDSGQSFFRINSFPFRMTDQRMEKEWKTQPRWIDFWVDLKEGYDFFENVNLPPDVGVEAGEYVFRIY
ncbi:MAG: hypothetical protein AAF491_00120 [Verrucomicrobiota bacterium]